MVCSRFAIFILIFSLIGCGGSSADDDDNGVILGSPDEIELDPNLPPEGSVEGVWNTTCFFNTVDDSNTFQINSYIRRGAKTFYRFRYYEAHPCTGDINREVLMVATTEEVGTLEEPIFGVTATSVLVTVSDVMENAASTGIIPEPFYDLIYRSGASLVLGLAPPEDSLTNVPDQLDWVLSYRYADL